MRAGEGQKPCRPDHSRTHLHIELHPGPPRTAAGGAAVHVGTDKDPRRRGSLEVVQGQFVVVHAPLNRRRRDTASVTIATAASISRSLEKRPRPNRRLASLNAS